MWGSAPKVDIYEYVRTNPYVIRLIGFLGIATTILMAFGLWKYTKIEFLYLVIFGPIILIFILNKLLRFSMQLFYPKFSISKHEKFIHEFWEKNSEPSVDIFLPWAGEDLSVHEEVVKAVSQIRYKNINVYMLDDVGNEAHMHIAQQYGFHYLSRPNKGEFKKSGNLEYGYRHSSGQFIFILDADFIPTKDSIYNLIPYIASDEEIGILQTPQYFEQTESVHKRSRIEFGGGNIVEDFYRVIMPCRDEFRAAMCVGTSAIYRREAILKLNGTPKVHASEDLATGLLITHFGYYVKYLPLIVSIGKSPETYQGYFKQHMRWCSGNLVFAKYWPFAHLNLVARIMYITNPLYYLSEAAAVVFSFQFLLLLYFHSNTLSLWNTVYFLPYIFLSRVIIPLTKTNKNKLGTRLAAISNSYTYFYTYIRMIFQGLPSWQPTGVKVSHLHRDFLHAFDIGLVISGLYIICFVFVLLTRPFLFGNYNAYILLGWAFYSVFWHAVFLTFVMYYIHPIQMATIQSKIGKAFLFVKTHSISFLSFILVGCSIFDATITLHTPKTPIALAFTQMANTYSQYSNAKIVSPTPSSVFAKVKTEKITQPITYIYTVISGDTLTKLAIKAIMSYSADKKIELTKNQLIKTAYILISMRKYRTPIHPGDTVSFDENDVKEAIKSTL